MREFVATQSDLISQTVRRVSNEKMKTRYINFYIYNVVEYCLTQLSEEAAI